MYHNSLIFVFLFIFTAPIYAEVYKCDDEGAIRYSTIPCNKQAINLELGEDEFDYGYEQEEQFITPAYPGWKNGWKKTKDLKLERFFEVVYEPARPTDSEKSMRINHQKLTNLPQSMSVQRFAISVEDIIESICASAIIYQPKSVKPLSDKVFYGQYACSFKRDTKQGELGYYKILRGENSIYMLAIKWSVEPFTIELDKPLTIIEDKQQKAKIFTAKKYLQNKVKLCTAGTCL
ncbi:MAG: hypothetical protein GY951_17490 [Psychromonas sp.]|nr:hypothetical protein [Psychromonas sp.]